MTKTITAPAKLTVSLQIVGTRPDGYHLIDAEMTTLDLADSLTITELGTDAESTISVSGPYAAGVPTDADNLVARALELTGRRASIEIVKNIPAKGGLGGGSADAAAVLRWAGFEDLGAAAAVGADIAFCMIGGRARVTGIGEIVEPLPPIDSIVTLIIPPLSVSTPAAYRAYDELRPPRSGPNDLEDAAIAVEPRLADWRDAIIDATGQRPVLAGSGATWYVAGRRGNALASLTDEGAQIHEVTASAPVGARR